MLGLSKYAIGRARRPPVENLVAQVQDAFLIVIQRNGEHKLPPRKSTEIFSVDNNRILWGISICHHNIRRRGFGRGGAVDGANAVASVTKVSAQAAQRLEPRPKPLSSSGHDGRSYTTIWGTIEMKAREAFALLRKPGATR